MKYYQEITLFPDAEMTTHFLLSKVFAQIHFALASASLEKSKKQIGISFPQYTEKELGKIIRIIAPEKDMLEELGMKSQLSRLSDYVHITTCRIIPHNKIRGYSVYSRYQPDEPVERKARRYVKRHTDVSYEEALQLLKQRKETYTLPYIMLKSYSSEQHFHLFIQKKSVEKEQEGTFNSYGLSATASVPEFLPK